MDKYVYGTFIVPLGFSLVFLEFHLSSTTAKLKMRLSLTFCYGLPPPRYELEMGEGYSPQLRAPSSISLPYGDNQWSNFRTMEEGGSRVVTDIWPPLYE